MRKNEVSKDFDKLYDTIYSALRFSSHTNCMASFRIEEKIRPWEVVFYKWEGKSAKVLSYNIQSSIRNTGKRSAQKLTNKG